MNAPLAIIKNIMKKHIKTDNIKTVSIVGANSYIARNLIFVLKQRKDVQIVGLYDRESKHQDGEDKYMQIDVLSIDSLKKINFNVDIIFDFIGKTGGYIGFDDYLSFINVNEVSLLNLLEEYRRQKSTAKFVFPSTRLVYKGKKGRINENDPKEFKSIYSLNKFVCESYLNQFHSLFDVQYCIFRICVPYGSLVKNASSYGTAEIMLSKARQGDNIILYGDGKLRRTITYIGDLCKMLIDGALSDRCSNDVFNIGGEDYSLKEMATIIAKHYGVGIDYVEWPKTAKLIETGDTVFSDQKIKNILTIMTNTNFKDWIKTQI